MLRKSAAQRPLHALGAKLWLALIGCVLALLLSEGLLRLFWTNPWAAVPPERVLTLRMHPRGVSRELNRSAIVPSDPIVRFRTDDRSYIMPSRQFDRPDFTVAFLGGSTTECSMVHESVRFPALVSELLAPRGFRVNTLNSGRSGNTLHDALLVFLNHVVEDRPDAVVIMHAANDVGVLMRSGSYESREGAPLDAGTMGRYLLQSASAWSWTAGFAREMQPRFAPAPIQRTGQNSVDDRARGYAFGPYNARLRALVRAARAFGVEPILMTEPMASVRNAMTPSWADVGKQDVFNGAIREVARDESVRLIDLALLVPDVPQWDQPMNVFYDAVHVSDAGSRIYAGFIADALAASLTSLRDRHRVEHPQ